MCSCWNENNESKKRQTYRLNWTEQFSSTECWNCIYVLRCRCGASSIPQNVNGHTNACLMQILLFTHILLKLIWVMTCELSTMCAGPRNGKLILSLSSVFCASHACDDMSQQHGASQFRVIWLSVRVFYDLNHRVSDEKFNCLDSVSLTCTPTPDAIDHKADRQPFLLAKCRQA